MKNDQQGRIITTVLSDVAHSFWEQRGFRPVATPNLGFGSKDYTGAESEYFEAVAFLINAAREEKSHVLLLGSGVISVPSSWIRAAELIIQGSEVRIVLIPSAQIITPNRRPPTVKGSLICVDKKGIFQVQNFGTIHSDEFCDLIIASANELNIIATVAA